VAGQFIRSTAPARGHRDLVRSTLELGSFEVTGAQESIVFAPDGKSIIYQGFEPGSRSTLTPRSRLYRYSLATGISEAIEGTEAGRTPFVSPDGRWLAFESFSAKPQLVKVPIGGGRPQSITSTLYFAGYSWGDDGFIVMGGPPYSGLLRVSADGGDVNNLTTPRPDDSGKDHRYPVMLPGSRILLYGVGTGKSDAARIVAEDLQTGLRKDLVTGTMAFRYSPSGHIVYTRDGAVFAQHFDASALAVTGAPVKIAEGVVDFFGTAEFAVSASGDLALVPGSKDGPLDQMILVTPAGEVTPIGPPALVEKPRFSPDGTMISVVRFGAQRNIWLYDLRRNTFGPITFGHYFDAIWDARGDLTLTKGRPLLSSLVSRPLGNNAAETALTQEIEAAQLPIAWVDGGQRLLFERQTPAAGNIWSIQRGKQPELLVETPFRKNRTSVSPDGRWLSYTSEETGVPQVYLQRLDRGAPRIQVSGKRGAQGAWAPNSRRLYFYGRAADDDVPSLWAVDIGGGPNPAIGTPIELFKIPEVFGAFDMSPDGKVFVMVRHLDVPIHSLRLVQNWAAMLAPTGK
jgi:serine/threonine-protein kinase